MSSNRQPWIKPLHPFLLLLTLLLLPSCATKDLKYHKQLLAEAGNYLSELKKSDGLPGFSKEEHGILHVHSAQPDYNLAGHFNKAGVTYPLTLIAEVSKVGDTSRYPLYQYELLKEQPGSTWRLNRAIRIDSNEHVVDLK